MHDYKINTATTEDCHDISILVGELLIGIMQSIGEQAFNFNPIETENRSRNYIQQGVYFVFVVRDIKDKTFGFITLCETRSLYAEGTFGLIQEFYVRPEYRSQKIGKSLLDQAKLFARSKLWKRLEVTTPPLPHYQRTIYFYEREGFAIAGGRKLRILL